MTSNINPVKKVSVVHKDNKNQLTNQQSSTPANIDYARQQEETRLKVMLAKQFPRDMDACLTRIRKECARSTVAENAFYSFPVSAGSEKKKIGGITIRLAEVLARNFGNIDYGVRVLGQRNGLVDAMAFCWDIENNVTRSEYFEVRLEKKINTDKEAKGYFIKTISDPREIDMHVAGVGSRRLRKCISSLVGNDVIEEASAAARTALHDLKIPVTEKAKLLTESFAEYDVTREMIEEKIKMKVEDITKDALIDLRGIFCAIKDMEADAASYFNFNLPKQELSLDQPKNEVEKDAECIPPISQLLEDEEDDKF